MGITICNGKRVEGYDVNSGSNSEAAVAAHNAACHEHSYDGAVLRLGEHNGYDDSDFYAIVWDEEQQAVRKIQYATTRGWTYHNGASIDASHEVIEKAVAVMTEARFADWQRTYGETPRKGYTARAVEKGETFEGVITWIGEKRQYSQWAARYAEPVKRYGIKVEGRKGLVFANADDEGFECDVPPMSAEDLVSWRAQCEHNVRAEFSQAQALADQRDPRPAPGIIVDAQEADAEGFRLYAVGETLSEESVTRKIAAAVLDGDAHGYRLEGVRKDGSALEAREITLYQALHRVALYADMDGALISHDGRGTVRLVRADGGRLLLTPVRPVEAAQGPQEDGERPGADVETQEAAKGAETAQEGPCTHPSECGAQPVGMVRATKAATGEGGIVGVYCSGHLAHPAEIFPEGYVFAYEALSAPVEGVEGTEGDPVWVARRDEALEVLRGLMDGGAGRYRRTVLIEGTDARGMSDTMPTAVARVYLAEEVADGGEVSKPGMGVRLVLVRENGARLELEPVRGVA
jgi:hypothetical protein